MLGWEVEETKGGISAKGPKRENTAVFDKNIEREFKNWFNYFKDSRTAIDEVKIGFRVIFSRQSHGRKQWPHDQNSLADGVQSKLKGYHSQPMHKHNWFQLSPLHLSS